MARETVDFTKLRKNKKRSIDYCPKCGRKGERHSYGDGSQMFIHKMRLGIVPIAWEITDSCYIEA